MVKYLINENIHGYEKITVNDMKATEDSDNLFVVIMDKSFDTEVNKYYKFINAAMKNRNKVILVSVDDDNKSFRPLASLMVTFENYGIYQVPDRESISAPYLLKLEEREPDLAEVQTYVGGDVTAYSDMSTILFGIESLVEEGNEEALKSFLETHMVSIENLTTTLNNMKKTCDLFNSSELIDAVNNLKDKEKKLKGNITDLEKSLEDVKRDRDLHFVNCENLKRENEKIKNKNMDLEARADSGGSVIKSYKEINTKLIDCKAKIIIYFKEISYVRYTNSLVLKLMEVIEKKKLKCKLLIYDSQSELYAAYKPLPVVNGSDYLNLKGTLISTTKQFVVAEPNPSILQDILMSEQCFDVVIIYDRMKGIKDIVTGNNVTKFFVINSSKEYNELKSVLKIPDMSHIITYAHSSIEKSKDRVDSPDRQFLDIPEIPGYCGATDSAKTSRYLKLGTSLNNVALIDAILKKSRVGTL